MNLFVLTGGENLLFTPMHVNLAHSHKGFKFLCKVFIIRVVSGGRTGFHNQKRRDMSHVSVAVVFMCKTRNAFPALKGRRQ